MTSLWSVGTEPGSNLSVEDFGGILSVHHDRMVDAWQALTPEQWEHPSRNPQWSVHDTARHVADVMAVVTAQVLDEPAPFATADFDPRTSPETWLAASAVDPRLEQLSVSPTPLGGYAFVSASGWQPAMLRQARRRTGRLTGA